MQYDSPSESDFVRATKAYGSRDNGSLEAAGFVRFSARRRPATRTIGDEGVYCGIRPSVWSRYTIKIQEFSNPSRSFGRDRGWFCSLFRRGRPATRTIGDQGIYCGIRPSVWSRCNKSSPESNGVSIVTVADFVRFSAGGRSATRTIR